VIAQLQDALDKIDERSPNPGRTESFRRLTRTEYANAIRDLLSLRVDVEQILPADESSHGFDNVTVSDLSPTLVSRYLSAAERISQLAVARPALSIGGDTVRIRPDITQDAHLPGLPLGSRGGARIMYHFPVSGTYEVQIRLMRDRNEELEGLREPHELQIRLDRRLIDSFKVAPPPAGQSDEQVDANLKTELDATAGPHELVVTFPERSTSLLETTRQPLNVHFNYYRHPRLGPAVYEVSIVGPHTSRAAESTASRERVFICQPSSIQDEEVCAERILLNLIRRAYRRPASRRDLITPMRLYHEARSNGGFEEGIERALSAILVNPHFLFRIETDPPGLAAGTAYQINDWELASRLSFFLWSSLPDEELLEAAEQGRLHEPTTLESQVRRMLRDPRSEALATNFAAQWLYLRNLDAVAPDMRLFPDFDHNLRESLREETTQLFHSMVQEDRSVLDLLRSEFTFLNERLAKHYGIPHVYGSRFRRVALGEHDPRGGLLRHASILTVTSYATRTSPVLRGSWVLKNLLGSPPPPPPPDVPALEDNPVAATLSVRQRLAAHSVHAACAACHRSIDPIGFALENFDAVGRWRLLEEGQSIDVSGGLPDGRSFQGVDGLEQALLDRPEAFISALTAKLMTYALGRGIEYSDAPTVRAIVSETRRHDDRWSALIMGIVQSKPFQMRRTP
jgi:hypothetical protein